MTNKQEYKNLKNKKNIIIIFDEIEEIVERRVLLLWKAIEIYLKNGKSYLFNFLNTSEYESFMKIFKYNAITKDLLRKKDFLKDEKIIAHEWENRLINNYEYILLLNKYSSRSFNDTDQYPIFPWLLTKLKNLENFNENENFFEKILIEYINLKKEKEDLYTNKNNILNNKYIQKEKIVKEIKDHIRKFKYPISLQKKDKREMAMAKYEDSEKEGEYPMHSGCHYSTSAYIFYYLMRQQPFCNLIIKLQGYELENTNRCFLSLQTIEFIIETGNDNRELIPEFFSKIEFFINLNCDHYGYIDFDKKKNNIMDDIIIDIFKGYKKNKKYPLSIYVYFILEHKKLLNSRIIGYYMNHWIDNVFGSNQFPPEKLRNVSCNIFHKYTYEHKINLENKLNKYINIKNLSENEAKRKINLIINRILNFGQTPYQIFQEAHRKLNLVITNEINKKNEKKTSSKSNNSKKNDDEEDEEDFDFESFITNSMRNQDISLSINGLPIYFQINPSINKIFVLNNKDNIIILNSQLFNKTEFYYYDLTNIFTIGKSNIFQYGILNEKSQYLIYKLKYSLSSFDNYKTNNNENYSDSFHTYYTEIINNTEIKTKAGDRNKNEIEKKKFKN